MPRRARRAGQFGASAHKTAIAAAAMTDQRISLVRPSTSEAGPAIRSATPRPSVANDTLNALWPAETSKAVASSGSRG
jgi:hypothetical protein